MRNQEPRLRTVAGRQWRTIAALVIASVLAVAPTLAQPLLVRELIEDLSASRPVALAASLLAAALLTGVLLDATERYLAGRAGEAAVLDLRRRVARHVLSLKLEDLRSLGAGDVISRLSSDVGAIRGVFTSGVFGLASSLMIFVGALSIMASIDLLLLTITAAILVCGLGVGQVINRVLQRNAHESQESLGVMCAHVEETLAGVRTVRALGATDRRCDEALIEAERSYRTGLAAVRATASMSPVVSLLWQCSFLALLGVGGSRVAAGVISVGDLVAFLLLLFIAIAPIAQGLQGVAALQIGLASWARVADLLARDVEPISSTTRSPARLQGQRVRLESVSAQHPDGTPALRNVSLDVAAGERVVLTGPSGGGKSTLLAVLTGFVTPHAGEVWVGDLRLDATTLPDVRDVIGYVEQEPAVFDGTILENLRLGAPDLAEDDAVEALRAVSLTGFERRGSRSGLTTPVGARGGALSGGERRRLALARVLILKRPILAIDEPGASLDGCSERLVMDSIAKFAGEATVMVVTHHLGNLNDDERVVMIDGGEIIADGSHSELLAKNSQYQALHASAGSAPSVSSGS